MTPRIDIIAADASTMPADRSSSRSAASAGLGAIASLGSWRAAMVAAPKNATPISNAAAALKWPMPSSGPMASAPTSPEMRPSLEFASTSSSSLRTTLGTNADFDTA